jgi:hypothetical protein
MSLGGRRRPSGMNPATRDAGEMMAFSEPLNEGIETKSEGGAAAPMQKAEQALHVE